MAESFFNPYISATGNWVIRRQKIGDSEEGQEKAESTNEKKSDERKSILGIDGKISNTIDRNDCDHQEFENAKARRLPLNHICILNRKPNLSHIEDCMNNRLHVFLI